MAYIHWDTNNWKLCHKIRKEKFVQDRGKLNVVYEINLKYKNLTKLKHNCYIKVKFFFIANFALTSNLLNVINILTMILCVYIVTNVTNKYTKNNPKLIINNIWTYSKLNWM